jgi:hypothetical protein
MKKKTTHVLETYRDQDRTDSDRHVLDADPDPDTAKLRIRPDPNPQHWRCGSDLVPDTTPQIIPDLARDPILN